MHRGVADENTSLLHHLFNMAQTQGIGHIPAHAHQHHLKGVVQPQENLAKCSFDQPLADIKHAFDYPEPYCNRAALGLK